MGIDETKTFRVEINIDCEYYAKDKQECEELVRKDFSGLEWNDDITITEIHKEGLVKKQ